MSIECKRSVICALLSALFIGIFLGSNIQKQTPEYPPVLTSEIIQQIGSDVTLKSNNGLLWVTNDGKFGFAGRKLPHESTQWVISEISDEESYLIRFSDQEMTFYKLIEMVRDEKPASTK